MRTVSAIYGAIACAVFNIVLFGLLDAMLFKFMSEYCCDVDVP